MKIEKVNFGNEEPAEITYQEIGDNYYDVWLYDNVSSETDEDGNVNYTADGVHLKTKLSRDEVLAMKNKFFEEDLPEPTITDVIEALDILTEIILGE